MNTVIDVRYFFDQTLPYYSGFSKEVCKATLIPPLIYGSVIIGLRVTAGTLALSFKGASKVSEFMEDEILSKEFSQRSEILFSWATKNVKSDLCNACLILFGSCFKTAMQNPKDYTPYENFSLKISQSNILDDLFYLGLS